MYRSILHIVTAACMGCFAVAASGQDLDPTVEVTRDYQARHAEVDKPLMDMAVIGAKKLKKDGILTDLDEYNITASEPYNVKIQHEYAVNGESRRYTGLHLLKHALHNTIPDITKRVKKLVNGELIEVKVRDGEKIQLANSKIDEIRSGFSA